MKNSDHNKFYNKRIKKLPFLYQISGISEISMLYMQALVKFI